MIETLLECKNVFIVINNLPLFYPVNFSLKAGDCLQISGHNGSGKTSLLRAIMGLKDYEGDIFRRDISNICHNNNLYLNFTVQETIEFWGIQKKPDLLNNIEGTKLVRDLSFGQKRKLAWTRLLSQSRQVWLLDEPLTNLDIDTQDIIIDKVREHLADGGAIILVTHLANVWQDIITSFIKLKVYG